MPRPFVLGLGVKAQCLSSAKSEKIEGNIKIKKACFKENFKNAFNSFAQTQRGCQFGSWRTGVQHC